MKTIVISLKNAIDRRKHISDLLLKNNIEYEFFDAISKYDINNHNSKYHSAVIATFLSHKAVLEHILNFYNKYEDYVLILEDDADSNYNIKNEIEKIIDYINDYDMIFLGWKELYNSKKYTLSDYFYKIDKFIHAHAYIINKKSINKIINNIGEANEHIDVRYSNLIEKGVINACFLRKKIFEQKNFESQIPKIKKIIII